VPRAQKNRGSLADKFFPVIFIFNLEPEGHAVQLDKVIDKKNKGPGINDKF